VREESEATGRTPLPAPRAGEAANDGGDGAGEARSADASPRSAGSSPEEAPAAKRAMTTTAGEDEAAGEVDGLAEAFAAAACIR
jgi:hypothetical protein